MIRKIGLWLTAIWIACMPIALAIPAENTSATTVTATASSGLIPEKIDAGVLNGFDPLAYWPWRSLTIRTTGSDVQAYVDILVENTTLASAWQGVNDRRLQEEGLRQAEIASLIALAPEGWAGILTRQHDQGEIKGSMIWMDQQQGWYFERFLPENLRLAVYLPESGQGFVTEPLTVRQYNGLIELDMDKGTARVMTNTGSALWWLKLFLRLAAALGLTLLAIMPVIDKGRGMIALIKAASSLVYFLLVLLLPALFEGSYVLALTVTQILLSASEAAVLYFAAEDKQIRPVVMYGVISLVISLALGIWWMA